MNSVMTTNDLHWLRVNAGERMDATRPDLFPPARAAFHRQRYSFAQALVQGWDVADIACGTGYGSGILSMAARSVVGVDIAPTAVDYATRMHSKENNRFICASADQTGLSDASVDAVVSFESIEHVPDDVATLREFTRLLRPSGLLIASVPNGWGLTRYHVRDYTRDSLLAALDECFEVMKLFNQNSGCTGRNNHGQPAGITPTTDENHHLAECLIVVAKKK